MTADHHELSRLGLIDELASRLIISHDDASDGHVEVAFTPTGETFGRCLVLFESQCRSIDSAGIEHTKHTHVALRVQGHQPHLAARGVVANRPRHQFATLQRGAGLPRRCEKGMPRVRRDPQ